MGKTYEALMAELSPERRARVEARTAELIAGDIVARFAPCPSAHPAAYGEKARCQTTQYLAP